MSELESSSTGGRDATETSATAWVAERRKGRDAANSLNEIPNTVVCGDGVDLTAICAFVQKLSRLTYLALKSKNHYISRRFEAWNFKN
jgi:hypothetical protein